MAPDVWWWGVWLCTLYCLFLQRYWTLAKIIFKTEPCSNILVTKTLPSILTRNRQSSLFILSWCGPNQNQTVGEKRSLLLIVADNNNSATYPFSIKQNISTSTQSMGVRFVMGNAKYWLPKACLNKSLIFRITSVISIYQEVILSGKNYLVIGRHSFVVLSSIKWVKKIKQNCWLKSTISFLTRIEKLPRILCSLGPLTGQSLCSSLSVCHD